MADPPPQPATQGAGGFVAALTVTGLLLLVVLLLLGGGAPQPALPGLPAVSPEVSWPLAIAPLLRDLLGAAAVGFALLAGGYLGPARRDTPLWLVAYAWTTVAVATLFLLALRLHELAPFEGAWSQMTGSVQARAAAMQLVLAAVVLGVAERAVRLALPVALVALVPPLLVGHARSGEAPWLAAPALVLHVGAASLWVGGLLALGWLVLRDRAAWADLLPTYSALALVCVLVVAGGGTVVALTRVGSVTDLVTSGYGAMVLAKVVGLLLLAGLGYQQRRRVVSRGEPGARTFLLLAGSELTLMTLVFAVAAALSQTPPP
jgi:putative copper export protein